MRTVIRQLRQSVLLQDGQDCTDGQLLEAFLTRKDEGAVAVLVRRHAGMVWGVCRRILRNHHDAEDAFQATFLVFARKAASVVPRDMIGNWLHGVAYQTALKARANAAKLKTREKQLIDVPGRPATEADSSWQDTERLLDQELNQLPKNYRAVVVLCDLEGKTRKEASKHLGWPEGTVAGRLARARAILAKQLTKRGVVLSSVSVAALLATNLASACAPPSVLATTIQAVALVAAGQTVPVGVLSTNVLTLTERVLNAMYVAKFKAASAVVLLLVLGFGLAFFSLPNSLATQPASDSASGGLGFKGVPDLTGVWHDDDWGTVKLTAAGKGVYEGTYSGTFGKDVGKIRVVWSADSKQFEGTWSEGTYRFGRLSLRLGDGGKSIRGAYSCDPKCEYKPGIPSLADLQWVRGEGTIDRDAAVPTGDDLKKTLVEMDRRLWAATDKGDWKAVDKLLAADHIGVSGNGRFDKAGAVASVKQRRTSEWSISEVEVQRLGDNTACITYIYSCKVLTKDGQLDQVRNNHRYSAVWAQRNGTWVMVFSQDSLPQGGQPPEQKRGN
jgi:RNA polymerase sigma factor (sigma-70 family)